jgi:RecA/RadA recombinase
MSEKNIRELTDKEKLLELKEWYSSKELSRLLDITEATISNFLNDKSSFATTNSDKLHKFFIKHVQENSKFEQIKNVYDVWNDKGVQFMVDTPDGFQYASRFIHKDSRACYDLRTDNFHIECSGDHLIETDKGWVKTQDIATGSKVLTKVGFEEVRSNEKISDSDVYDMTIEHDNHRYWGGAGISSHNSGKSFLMAKAIADAQKEGYMVAVIDSEQAVSQDYLKKVGVDLDPSMLMTVQVQTVEQTQDMLLEVLEGVKAEQKVLGGTDKLKLMLIVDSIGMLTSNKALSNAEDGHHAADMGTKAKALTNMFNQIVQKVGMTDTVCLVTNHGAMEVGVMFPQMKPKGGQSCEFVPSISLRVTKGKIKPTDLDELEYMYENGIPKHLNALGIVSRIELYKSRFTRPFRKVQLMIPYDFGLPEHAGLFDYLKDNGIIIEGGRKGYYNCTEVTFEKDFTRKDFIKGGWADQIMNHLIAEEAKGHVYDFIMKSSDESETQEISEVINDSVKN